MGAFLSEPVTDKISADEEHDRLSYGVCSMQGWRFSQEDNHSCFPALDEKTSLFGVYDGHGGAEVSRYVASLLPDYVLQRECWKEGQYGKALSEAFLALDAHLGSRKGLKVLKKLAAEDDAALDKNKSSVDDDGESEDSEENVRSLFKEAKMPLEALMAKYGKALAALRNAPDSSDDEDKDTASGSAKGSKAKEEGEEGSGSSGPAAAAKDEDVEDKPKENGLPDDESTTKNGSDERSKLRSRQNRIVYSDNDDEDDSSDEEYDENSSLLEEGTVEEGDEDEEGSSDVDEDDEDDDEDELEGSLATSDEFAMNMLQGPGLDSGCTAVVAVLDNNGMLYVANAGDSRCIVSRRGVAIDMSVDHKPEDEEESKRILEAGGEVTAEGRVNGGLNLSRALGDHAYKQGSCGARKQMISALPDVRRVALRRDEDEFMVLACDGIWNSMTSQDVVDFVRKRLYKKESEGDVPADLTERRKLSEGTKLSEICGEMFEHCLAPNTSGDGTGCDNMTAILVTFKEAMFLERKDDAKGEEGNGIVLLTPPPSPELPKEEDPEEEEEEDSSEEEEEVEEEVEEEEIVISRGKGCKRVLKHEERVMKSKKPKVEEDGAEEEAS